MSLIVKCLKHLNIIYVRNVQNLVIEMLDIELKSHHMVIVLDSDLDGLEMVLRNMAELSIKNGFRRFVIHVISTYGNPYYLEKLRYLLQSITSYTVVVRYEGSSSSDLLKLINKLPSDSSIFIRRDSPLIDALKERGLNIYLW